MRTKLGRLAARWPFLSLGVATFALFLVAEASGRVAVTIAPVLRVLVAPLWLMRTAEVLVGIGTWPRALQLLIAVPLLFLPYLIADLVLSRLRRQVGHRAPAT